MAEKPSPRLRIAPLQRVRAEPVTDLAEQAALDEVRRRKRSVAAGLVSLYRQLPLEERASLIARLAAEVPEDTQVELLAELAAQLPPGVLPALEEELQTRLDRSVP
jgi:hypothetical protein